VTWIYEEGSYIKYLQLVRDILFINDFLEPQDSINFTEKIQILYQNIIGSLVAITYPMKQQIIKFIDFISTVVRKSITYFLFNDLITLKVSDYDRNLDHGVLSYDIGLLANSSANDTTMIATPTRKWLRLRNLVDFYSIDLDSSLLDINISFKVIRSNFHYDIKIANISVIIPTNNSKSIGEGTYRVTYMLHPKFLYTGDGFVSTHMVSLFALDLYNNKMPFKGIYNSFTIITPFIYAVSFVNNSTQTFANSCKVYAPSLKNILAETNQCYVTDSSTSTNCVMNCNNYGKFVCVCFQIKTVELSVQINDIIKAIDVFNVHSKYICVKLLLVLVFVIVMII